jgi:hypothetical protein
MRNKTKNARTRRFSIVLTPEHFQYLEALAKSDSRTASSQASYTLELWLTKWMAAVPDPSVLTHGATTRCLFDLALTPKAQAQDQLSPDSEDLASKYIN